MCIFRSQPTDLTVCFSPRHVACNEAIDLLNVAFEQQQQRTNSKTRHGKTGSDPQKDPFEVPDRITGRVGVKELNPKRKWNFVEVTSSIIRKSLL